MSEALKLLIGLVAVSGYVAILAFILAWIFVFPVIGGLWVLGWLP